MKSQDTVMSKTKIKQEEVVTEAMLSDDDQKVLKEDLQKWRKEDKVERGKLTLFSAPLKTLYLFVSEISLQAGKVVAHLARHPLVAFLLVASLVTLAFYYFVPGLHQQKLDSILHEATIALEWIVLGVLSSIGLGTGLHTFLLYLGPFIAKVTLASTECNSTDFAISGPNAFLCPTATSGAVTFWQIFWKVQSAAFFWGFGTAIGELPPFFVARSARLAGKKLEETQEEDDDDDDKGSLFHKIMNYVKGYLDVALGRFAFVSIVLMASIPNPFFDLAGLTCGYSLISFWTFFIATGIGKAGIKAHMQAVFVIIMFSKHQLELVVDGIEYVLPFLKGKARAFFDKERAKFHPENIGKIASGDQSKSMIARAWDLLLLVMLTFFAVSIINSTAQTRLMEQQMEQLESKKKQRIQELLASKKK